MLYDRMSPAGFILQRPVLVQFCRYLYVRFVPRDTVRGDVGDGAAHNVGVDGVGRRRVAHDVRREK